MDSKVYRHKIFVNTSMTVKVDGKSVKVSFKHGTINPRRNGFVRVNDKKLQEAIEKHPDYKVKFFLEKVNGKYVADIVKQESVDIILERKYKELEKKYNELEDMYNTVVAEKEVLIQKIAGTPEVTPPENEEDTPPENEEGTPEMTIIEVANIQEAKEILKKEPYNVAPNRMIQEAAVLNRAKEVNVEFKFPE